MRRTSASSTQGWTEEDNIIRAYLIDQEEQFRWSTQRTMSLQRLEMVAAKK